MWRQLWRRFARNQRGMQTIEWIGIGLVVLTITTALAGFFGGEKGAGQQIGETVKNKITGWIEDIGKSDGKDQGGDNSGGGSGGGTQ